MMLEDKKSIPTNFVLDYGQLLFKFPRIHLPLHQMYVSLVLVIHVAFSLSSPLTSKL